MGKLTLKNLVFYGYHGVQEYEKELGGRFEVDIVISYPFRRAATGDHLPRAVDYQKVYEVVKAMVTTHKYHLIETLADHVADAILDQFEVDEVQVIIRKTKVPIDAVLDYVQAEVTRTGKHTT